MMPDCLETVFIRSSDQLVGWSVSAEVIVCWYDTRLVEVWSVKPAALQSQFTLDWVPGAALIDVDRILFCRNERAVLLQSPGGTVADEWQLSGNIVWTGTMRDGKTAIVCRSSEQLLFLMEPGAIEPVLSFRLPMPVVDEVAVKSNVLGLLGNRLFFFVDERVEWVDLSDLSDWQVLWEGDVCVVGGGVCDGRVVFWDQEQTVRCLSALTREVVWESSISRPVQGFWQSESSWLLWSVDELLGPDGLKLSSVGSAASWRRLPDGDLAALLWQGVVAFGSGVACRYGVMPGPAIDRMEIAGAALVVQQQNRLSVHTSVSTQSIPDYPVHSIGGVSPHGGVFIRTDGRVYGLDGGALTDSLWQTMPDEVHIEGGKFVLVRYERTVCVWDGRADSVHQWQTQTVPERVVMCGEQVVAAERWSSGLVVYDMRSGREHARVTARHRGGHDRLVSLSGDCVAGWYADSLFVYQGRHRRFVTHRGHRTAVCGCVSLGKRFLSWDVTGCVRIWSSSRVQWKLVLPEDTRDGVFSLSGRCFISWGRMVHFWTLEGQRWVSTERKIESPILQIVGQGNNRVAALHESGVLWIHSVTDSVCIARPGHCTGQLSSAGGLILFTVPGEGVWLSDGEQTQHVSCAQVVSACLPGDGGVLINYGTHVESMFVPLPIAGS